MGWRKHTDCPDNIESVLIAIADDDVGGALLIPAIYIRNCAIFRDEITNLPPRYEEFWWIPESEVLQGLGK